MKHRETIPFLEESFYNICYYPTGSRYICYPPPDNTDEDYIVLVPRLKTAKFLLEIQGFKTNSREYEADETTFMSFKKELDDVLVNLIVTDYDDFYNQYITATEDAKERNLLNKADRIKLFDDYINYRI